MSAYDPSTLTDAQIQTILAAPAGFNDIDDAPSDQAIRNYNAVLAEASKRELIPFAPDVVGPIFVKNGVRMFVTALVWVLNFYSRHKATIDPIIEQVIIDHATGLLANIALLKAHNQPGPN